MRTEYSYEGVPTVRKFSNSDAFIRGIMGPFGSGKSSGNVMELPRIGMEQTACPDGIRRTRFGVIRNTYRQLRETTLETVMHWLPENQFGKYNIAEHRYNITAFNKCEIELLFCALDRPDQVANLLSLELTGAFVNEAREVPWAIIKPLMGRVGRYRPMKTRCTWSGIMLDTNPPDPESWWYELFEAPTERVIELARVWAEEYYKQTGVHRAFAEIFKQPSGLSPEAENLRYLDPGYYQLLAIDPDDDWVKVHVHGEYGFIKTGKPVYPTYRDNMHCKKFELIPGRIIRRGWDFGLTPACTFSQTTPAGQFRIRYELCADRAGIETFADEVLAFCRESLRDYDFIDKGDPAGNTPVDTNMSTCFEILEAKGVHIEPGPVSLIERLEPVRYGLNTLIDGEPALIVHPDAVMVRRGFQGGYQYKRMITSAVRYSDKPDKNAYSHPHDTVQYTAADHFGPVVMGDLQQMGHATPGHVVTPEPPAQRRSRSRSPFKDSPDLLMHQQNAIDDFDPSEV